MIATIAIQADVSRQFEVAVPWTDPEARAYLPSHVRATLVGPDGAPLLIVLGGISATADVVLDADGKDGWWSALFTSGTGLNLNRYRVLALDFAADETGLYAPAPRDQAETIQAALAAIGEDEAFAILGASYGGMVAMAYAERFQPRNTLLAIISADASPHPSATALRSLQRRIVGLGQANDCVLSALSIARGLAMISYRSPTEFGQRFVGGISCSDPLGCSEPGDYLSSRGDAFTRRMTPERFLSLSASIDRQRVDVTNIRNRALLVGVVADQLVPLSSMSEMALAWGGQADLHAFNSIYGHDAFLKEATSLSALLGQFLESAAP